MKKRGINGNSKNIWLLGSSSFFNDIGSEMIDLILPFYILSLGGGGIALGLISGLKEGLSSIFKIFGGYVSDRTGKRRVFVFVGYFISAIFKFLIGLANSWHYLIGFVSIERLGKARDAPRDAIISQSGIQTGRSFSIVQAMDTLGSVVGTLIVLFLFWKFSFSLKTIIFAAAGISAISLIPLFFVKEPKFKTSGKNLIDGIVDLRPELKYFIFVSSVFAFTNIGLYAFFLVVAKNATNSFTYATILYLFFTGLYALFLVPFGKLSDKIGRKKILLSGYLLFFLVAAGFGSFKNVFHLAILFSLYGLVYAMIYSNQKAFVSDVSGKMKGTAFGFFHMITGLAGIGGGIVAGILWNSNPKIMFVYLSAMALVSFFLLCFVKEKKKM
ncbi:MFS transporter [Candidatus Pacearchaeota archaeon]|nr:MFS transporter [Candidatus Pacearchaeota archaeon]